MKLYFSRNPNPRLAVAVARYLKSPVTFEFARPFQPDQRERFRRLNPNLSIPILELEDRAIWEGDAIACYLSQYAASDFWPLGESLPDIIRWLSWGHWNFVRACNMVQFERVTRQRYGMGPVRNELVEEGLEDFSASAEILEQHFTSADWLIGKGVTYADFRMATQA
jgi:glutathione S-transferase